MKTDQELPDEDGYYWVLLGPHKMNRIFLEENKFTIIYLFVTYHSKKRYIRFVESDRNKSFTIKYFKERAKFGEFIKIQDPN